MMRFRPLWPVLIGVFLSVASVCTDNVAVAFVDVKFDDKAAIWSLLLDRRYDRVIAVTSGINEHGQAAQELHQYLERQNAMASIKFNPNKIEVLRGTNALQESAPHEKWWQGNPSLATDAADYGKLQRALHGSRVRVFQLAPTTPDQVRTLIDAADAGSIDSYMLLHGYNSRQINMEWQTYFLRNLRSWLVARDPHADVYFTTSFDSYAAKNGGKQLISDIHGMFPEKDLKQALQDPFWSRQLLKAHQEGLTSTPFPQQDVKKLDDLIYQARTQPEKYKAWRDYISHYIQNEVLAHHPETSGESRVLGRLRYTLLPEFRGPSTVELADAAHVAAFHRYLDGVTRGQSSGMSVEPVVYPEGPHRENAKVGFQSPRDDELHGWLLRGADRDADLLHIKRLAGVLH